MKKRKVFCGFALLIIILISGCNKAKPEANFTADVTEAIIGQTVSFTDLSSESPTSWVWVFDPSAIDHVDGTSAISQHTKVKFKNAGSYTVTLTASNDKGSGTKTVVDYIKVEGK